MVASEFFVKGRLYKYVGPECTDFKQGAVYKFFGIIEGWSVIETKKTTTIYRMFGPTANGFADGHPSMINVEKKFVPIENKSHLPKWW